MWTKIILDTLSLDTDIRVVEEAEKFLGVKASAIRNYLYLNKLTTYKFKGLTLISKRELENWK